MNNDKEEKGEAGEVVSYADIRGEWEDRKVSLFGAVKSFIGQLKVGQDLTKVSLPCVFLRPYSLLEEVASRNFGFFPILFDIPQQKTPLKRMLFILKWLVATAKQEHYNHKPFNPVIGEINRCYYNHDPNNPEDTTYFIVEQVKHHPPTCGIRMDNPYRDITLQGFYTFQVQFNRNSVTIANNGTVHLRVGKETYTFAKAMPDMLVKNVILGTKLVVWDGKLTLECKETGLTGDFELFTKDRTNLVKGKLFTKDEEKEPIAHLEGKCGGPTHWWYNSKHPSLDKDLDKKAAKEEKKRLEKHRILVDEPEKRTAIVPTYPTDLEENCSVLIWKPVRECIIPNKMDEGDIEKQKIEDRQRGKVREREEKGESWEPEFFVEDGNTNSWKIKDEKWYTSFKK
eukprot:TRINITY_DN2140_c0_g1_i1.p1 TRINITY_DN2140_c0_g1~~TRINITY_DN2140_c0_g1_i1.p1  ORF type:complete len:398 (-),score=90.13 TRINITY_DN2140_c0_g1_i1:38-1231(-)